MMATRSSILQRYISKALSIIEDRGKGRNPCGEIDLGVVRGTIQGMIMRDAIVRARQDILLRHSW